MPRPQSKIENRNSLHPFPHTTTLSNDHDFMNTQNRPLVPAPVSHFSFSHLTRASSFVIRTFSPAPNRNSSAREMLARCDAELSRHGDSVSAYLTRAKIQTHSCFAVESK